MVKRVPPPHRPESLEAKLFQENVNSFLYSGATPQRSRDRFSMTGAGNENLALRVISSKIAECADCVVIDERPILLLSCDSVQRQ